jgi:hypothetical protein
MVFWDDLGFATDYRVEPEPEYPGDGEWRYRDVFVGLHDDLRSVGPQALIEPLSGEPWLLRAGFSGLGALYGHPNPSIICLFERYARVTLINTQDPGQQALIDEQPVSVASAVDEQLLLIGGWAHVTAYDSEGPKWTSAPLFDDDLHIRRTDNGRIVCRGHRPESLAPVEVTLDARTGEVMSG